MRTGDRWVLIAASTTAIGPARVTTVWAEGDGWIDATVTRKDGSFTRGRFTKDEVYHTKPSPWREEAA